MADQYTTPTRSGTAARTGENYYVPDKVSLSAPLDRVRWASVLAGVFTVLASLVFFTVLGLAIGLASYEPGANMQNFGLGAGIYGLIAALISFGLGGFLSARTTAVAGSGNALLNGAMVWIVTIALIVNLLGAGLGTILNLTTSAVEAVAPAAGAVADDAAAAIDDATTGDAAAGDAAAGDAAAEGGVVDQAAQAAQSAQQQLQQVDPQDVDRATEDVSNAAWFTLLGLGLTAAAAIAGGMLGTRNYPTDIAVADLNDSRRTS